MYKITHSLQDIIAHYYSIVQNAMWITDTNLKTYAISTLVAIEPY